MSVEPTPANARRTDVTIVVDSCKREIEVTHITLYVQIENTELCLGLAVRAKVAPETLDIYTNRQAWSCFVRTQKTRHVVQDRAITRGPGFLLGSQQLERAESLVRTRPSCKFMQPVIPRRPGLRRQSSPPGCVATVARCSRRSALYACSAERRSR